jgi:hypothetical protein
MKGAKKVGLILLLVLFTTSVSFSAADAKTPDKELH